MGIKNTVSTVNFEENYNIHRYLLPTMGSHYTKIECMVIFFLICVVYFNATSDEAYKEFPHLTRPALATKHAAPLTTMLVHHDAASCQPPAGERQPTAPTTPHQQRQRRLACQQPC